MAIVEMKRISLLAMRQDRKKLLRAMQKMGCVEVSPIADEELKTFHESDRVRLDKVGDTLTRLAWLIAQMGRYNPQRAPLLGNKPAADDGDVAFAQEHEGELERVIASGEALEKESGELKGRLARLQAAEDQLSPWRALDIPVQDLHNSRDVAQFVGTVHKAALPLLTQSWEGKPVCVQGLGEVRENAYVWIAAHMSVRDEVAAGLKEAEFAPVQFGEARGTVEEQLADIARERRDIAAKQDAVTSSWQELSKQLTRMKTWYDLLQIERDQLEAAGRTVGTGTAFMLRGWVPAGLADKVSAELKALSPTCSVDITEHAEGDDPPVLLHNNKYAAPFESIIEGFSMPSPYGIDPTAVMAPFYACLFGMMLSDAGYGLVMAIAIPFLVKLLNPGKSSRKLMWVIFFGSLATVFWGAMYNSWFGFSLPISTPFDPIKNPMPVMILCVAVGVVHLFAGLGMAAYLNFRRGKPLDAVYDQFSWAMLLIGLGLLIAGGSLASVGKWLAIAGAGIIVLFAGRAKSKNPFKRVLSGLGALYGASSWISDILSYMRLFGMGLATGVIGMVINKLVGMVFQLGIVGVIIGSVLFVAAHAFNLGINTLGAYVHSCRLQYIEFFGKFYEEGGVAFRPLAYNTRYVNVKQA